jgi:hypothetical protein
MMGPDFLMDEVASLSIRTVSMGDVDAAFFGFVFGVDLLISP